MASKRVHKNLSIEEKFQLINEIDKGSKKTDVAEKYGIASSTVSMILRNKVKISNFVESGALQEKTKRIKKPTYDNIDKAVFTWFAATRAQNMPISGRILMGKAMEYAKKFKEDDFKASTGWLDKWKLRHGVRYRKACGESNAVSEEDCQKWKTDILPSFLEKYNESEIFNADESELFYKCLPDKTLTFRNEKCHRGKHSKDRVTIMLAANMNGTEKLKILVIGKSNKPRCFRGIKSLPVDYKNKKRAWMTGQIFEEWMVKFDKQFTAAGRKVLFFIDNCPAHPKDIRSKLKSIELVFFPANMTSKLQPLDQGVIRCLKAHYRNRVLKEAITRIEENSKSDINLLLLGVTFFRKGIVIEKTGGEGRDRGKPYFLQLCLFARF